jgi:hypothetical protein
VPLLGGDLETLGPTGVGIRLFHLVQMLEVLVPALLECPSDQAMLRLHSIVLAFRALHRIPSPLQLRVPVPVESLGVLFHLLEDGQGELQVVRGQGGQYMRFDTGIEGTGWDRPTETPLAIVQVTPGALIDGVPPPCPLIPDGHPPPTPATEDEPL